MIGGIPLGLYTKLLPYLLGINPYLFEPILTLTLISPLNYYPP
jgi:hypothetical protein